MGKFVLLNILVVVLAVYVSARYTYQKQEADIDGEIDAIANSLDKRDGLIDLEDCDLYCEDIDNCDCYDERCLPEECFFKRDIGEDLGDELDGDDENEDGTAVHGVQKKFIRFPRIPRIPTPRIPRIPRIPIPRIPRIPRIPIPRIPRIPRIPFPRIPRIPRFPRIPRIPRFRFGKK